jgi:arylsulfatase A-like enzyme
MSAAYGKNVRAADAGVARLITIANRAYGEGNFTMIVTADHGGHGRNHGSDDPRDVTIPWITWGRGVSAGTTIADSVRTMDTASTVLWLLGLREPTDWSGAPVSSAYTSEAQQAVALAAASASN